MYFSTSGSERFVCKCHTSAYVWGPYEEHQSPWKEPGSDGCWGKSRKPASFQSQSLASLPNAYIPSFQCGLHLAEISAEKKKNSSFLTTPMALPSWLWVKSKVIASSIMFITLWNNPYALLISSKLIAGDSCKMLHTSLQEIDQRDLEKNEKIFRKLQTPSLNNKKK